MIPTVYEELLAEMPLPDPTPPIPWIPFAEWPLPVWEPVAE